MLVGFPIGEVPVEDTQDTMVWLIEELVSLCSFDGKEEISGIEGNGPALSEGIHDQCFKFSNMVSGGVVRVDDLVTL